MTAPLRVLLVEDSPSDATLVLTALRALERPIEHERVEDPVAMRAALERSPWDIVLSDWSMPRFSALLALYVVKELGLDLPFIIVSGTVGEESAAEAMRAGAHDYVLKDKLARLVPAIERELREAKERSARRAAEQALRLSDARFRALVEKSADGIVVTDREGTLLYVSPAAARIFGRPAEAMLGTTAFDYGHPDERDRALEDNRTVAAERDRVYKGERRMLRPDGSCRWIEFTGTNMVDDPAVGGVVRNIRDVTEQREAVDALRASEARFARLADSGMVGIALSDVHGGVHDANDEYLRIVGYSRDDLRAGKVSWAAMTPPELEHLSQRAAEQLASRGIASPWETEQLRKDGSRVSVLAGVALLEYPNTIAFVADLTERKRAEATLRDTENQLRQAQKMEAVGRLAGGVAHDFNNMLSVILSYSDLLSHDLAPDDPHREDVEEIAKAGHRAADLTRQLLTFSRQQVIAPRVLDLNEVLSDMTKMLTRVLGEDIELTLTRRAVGRIRVDPSSIEQVVMNLAVNARDAMPKGGKLTIETATVILDEGYTREHVGAKPGPHVLLAVSDTGIGMDAATQAHIFEPFFTTKETGKGTGLGLSMVFGIVLQSGGSIRVYSEPGRGTSFKIYLPHADAAAQPAEASLAPTTLRGTETILLVEDEDAVRAVARSILARSGYEVLEARDGAEAIAHGEKHRGAIHLLLTDVVMPKTSGPELAKRLVAERPEMRVLCMSGYTDDSIVRHGFLESSSAFLQKPFTPATLTRKVREVLDATLTGSYAVERGRGPA